MNGNVFAHLTATRTSVDGVETHGWVDPEWSMTEFMESRNDAGEVFNLAADDEDLYSEVLDAAEQLLGEYTDNGDGTYYGQDELMDGFTGAAWTYALHFVHKFHGPKGWTEEPFKPHVDYPHTPGTLYDCPACEASTELDQN